MFMTPNLESTSPLVYQLSDGRRIKLTAEVVARLQRHAQHAPDAAEAGGVLLGRYLSDSDDLVVDDITEPLPGDKRGRYFFHRAQKNHQQAIEQAWRASNGTRTYLGEWHTHPEARPTPSCIDTCDWRRKLRQDQYFERLFFFIVGTHEVRGWSGSRNRPKPIALEPLLVS
ncbi:integrative and conjugative element protein, VC0181 family [Hymenobacter arizonensis]|uniref:Integrative and conjugative element protein, VC0181 family n=2 Tax=Hymenobacter arizonensis TaxID=1227077 RepID=A0A1I6BMM3_HYMAR|nr:integrative and conjugative element protein, VC0181 family [Hymenobacter arizonensis]